MVARTVGKSPRTLAQVERPALAAAVDAALAATVVGKRHPTEMDLWRPVVGGGGWSASAGFLAIGWMTGQSLVEEGFAFGTA